MPTQAPLLRVTPSQVRIGERYRYRAWLGASRDVQFESGDGRIMVVVPWDGERHLSRDAVATLSRWPRVQQVQIGWLALGAPLEWEYGWERLPQADIRPFVMRVRDPQVRVPGDWTADRWRVVLEDTFEVVKPRFQALEMAFQVLDDWQSYKPFFQDGLQRPMHQDDIRWIWGLELTVWLPRMVLQAHPNLRVYLEEMRLKWPWIPRRKRDVEVQIWAPRPQRDGEKMRVVWEPVPSSPSVWQWRYLPDMQSLQLRRVPFGPDQQPAGSSLVPWRARVFLLLRTVGPTITEDVLQGYFHIRIQGALLSGREWAWLDARGRRDEAVPLEPFTILSGTFEAYLSESFAHRPVTTYHHWYARGVALTEERLRQVAGVLHDMGYEIQEFVFSDQRRRVRGVREVQDAQGHWHRLILEVRLETAAQYRSRRQRATASEITITTQTRVEDLWVHCWGYSTLPGSQVSAEVLALQERLTQRFRALEDLY